jgi:spermidine/putrescine transport system permease protein
MAAAAQGRPRARWTRLLLPTYTWAIIIYLMLPIFVMIVFGFNDTGGRLNFQWQGFTLEWYENLFDIPDLAASIRNSILVAITASVVSSIIGTMAALALGRYRFRGQALVDLVIFMAIATPEVVIGSSLLSLFITLGLPRGFLTIFIAHVMFNIAFVAITVRARISTLDRSLEEAAADLGATPWVGFWRITFPLIFPGVLAGNLLAFALSLDDYIITSFVAGQTTTFPLWVVGASRVGVPPQVNVMGTILFVVGLLLTAGTILTARRADATSDQIQPAAEAELKAFERTAEGA